MYDCCWVRGGSIPGDFMRCFLTHVRVICWEVLQKEIENAKIGCVSLQIFGEGQRSHWLFC